MTISPPPSNELSTLDLHLSPVAAFLSDSSVTEIVIDRPGQLRLERASGWDSIDIPALDFNWCMDLARLLRNRANQDLTEDWPLLGAQMPGGLRAQIVVPPAVDTGKVSFTIRRPISRVLSMDELIDGGGFVHTRQKQAVALPDCERKRIEAALPQTELELLELFRIGNWKAFFETAVRTRKNIVSSGATGAGKTTLSNALAAMIPLDERIITIEDVAEMRLPHPNQVNLYYPKGANGISKLKAQDLLEASLRMRPDRVLLAELRGDETYFFVQNVLNSGHPGTITTVHATSAKLAFHRLALLIKSSPEGSGLGLSEIMENLSALVDIVVQMERQPDGKRIASEVFYDPAFVARQLA